jgi:hypothetical protein
MLTSLRVRVWVTVRWVIHIIWVYTLSWVIHTMDREMHIDNIPGGRGEYFCFLENLLESFKQIKV